MRYIFYTHTIITGTHRHIKCSAIVTSSTAIRFLETIQGVQILSTNYTEEQCLMRALSIQLALQAMEFSSN